MITAASGGEYTLKCLNLKTAVGREKTVQAIDVHREFKNCVVTFWVMSQFFNFLGASRDCADFRDPTAVFRIIEGKRSQALQNEKSCLVRARQV